MTPMHTDRAMEHQRLHRQVTKVEGSNRPCANLEPRSPNCTASDISPTLKAIAESSARPIKPPLATGHDNRLSTTSTLGVYSGSQLWGRKATQRVVSNQAFHHLTSALDLISSNSIYFRMSAAGTCNCSLAKSSARGLAHIEDEAIGTNPNKTPRKRLHAIVRSQVPWGQSSLTLHTSVPLPIPKINAGEE